MTKPRHAVLEGTRIPRLQNPDDSRIEAAVRTLARESVVVLSETNDDNTYIQVWQRPDGLYQLEHRAGSPLEHFQTVTVSADKVHAAFTAWLDNDEGWADPFTWKPISELF
ncbi:hypothetical protein FXN61_10920 [Lentzea sp. PSKA42]|uniref:Uncharacterized protein n=1 Tax=Lentzea indica TaxID=2604800 RepID=A0ABX1FEM6_9PSEU|nr:hypothetical protein [Lentzea indica]NKE57317.1 hypothetical protein [Lentzea indica]